MGLIVTVLNAVGANARGGSSPSLSSTYGLLMTNTYRHPPTFRYSSTVEYAAVNRLVVGSNPTTGAKYASLVEW